MFATVHTHRAHANQSLEAWSKMSGIVGGGGHTDIPVSVSIPGYNFSLIRKALTLISTRIDSSVIHVKKLWYLSVSYRSVERFVQSCWVCLADRPFVLLLYTPLRLGIFHKDQVVPMKMLVFTVPQPHILYVATYVCYCGMTRSSAVPSRWNMYSFIVGSLFVISKTYSTQEKWEAGEKFWSENVRREH